MNYKERNCKEMNYQEAVAAAASALDLVEAGEDRIDAERWTVARLTWENTFRSGPRKRQPGRVTRAQWCADVNASRTGKRPFTENMADVYIDLWEQFGVETQAERSPSI